MDPKMLKSRLVLLLYFYLLNKQAELYNQI